MIPNKGRYLDCNPINQPPGTWRLGKNMVANVKKGSFANEPGTDLTATNFPYDQAKPIGSIVFPDGSYVVCADGINGGKDRIGFVSVEGVYTDKIVDDALNFDSHFPIRSSEIDYNARGDRIIGFTDARPNRKPEETGGNPLRVMNLDDIPFELDANLGLVDPSKIINLEAFPKFKLPIVDYTINQVGGSLLSGAYSVAIAYEDNDGTRTPTGPPSKMIYITEDTTGVGFDKFDGCPPRTLTSKSITFNVTNVDTRYDKLVLVIVRKFGGSTEVVEVKKLDINGTTVSLTYLGTENELTLTTEEILTTRPLYTKVGAITQLNSVLYAANLEAHQDIEYQEYANSIKIFYNTKLVNVQDLNNSQKNGHPSGFPHGGVCAFYIAFALTNGSWSRAFHIPGRPALPGGSSTVVTPINRPVNIVSPYEPAVGVWDPAIFSQANFDNSSGFITTTITFNGSTLYPGVNIVVAVTPSYAIFQHTFIGNEFTSVTENISTVVTTPGDGGPSSLAGPAGLPAGTRVYQIEDTTNKPLPAYTLDGDTNRVSNLSGLTNMGYWENQNEVYPAGFPGLAGLHVRHHVFPTIRKCKQVHYSSDPGYGRDKLDILGIDVSGVIVPPEIAAITEGWAIFYAERDYGNSNTLGNDLYLVAHKSDDHPDMIWSAGGNWRAIGLQDGSNPGWDDVFRPNKNYLRGHNFELLKDKPAMAPGSVFLDFEMRLKKENLSADFLTFGKAGGNIADSGGDPGPGGRPEAGQNSGVLIDETDTSYVTASLPTNQIIKAVEEYKYYPSHIVDGQVRTMKNEETIHMKIYQGDNIDFIESEINVRSEGRGSGPMVLPSISGFTNGGEETYLLTYKLLKSDLYVEFNNQLLVMTDTLCLNTESFKTNIRGGDTFLSIRSFLCISPRHPEDTEKINGTTVIRAHVSESRYNIGLRHEDIGDVTTKYYPKTAANEFWTIPTLPSHKDAQMLFDRTVNPNGLAYNIDYNTLNTYIQPIIFNVNQKLTNKFPYRVIRGGSSSGASVNINSWKTFLSADYYESNRNRGMITDLFTLDDNLFIHHMYGLFRTLGTEKLSLGTTEVYLGTGDIFSQKPKEPLSTKLGFLGSQNIFAGVSFKGNRFWVDQSQGRVFLINRNGVNELSDNGMYQFFRDNLRIDNTFPDNPLEQQGILATYDPKFDRIILTKKSDVDPFTISYSMEKEQNFWDFNHDYIPDYLFCTSNDFFGYKNGMIHKFNSPTRKCRYFEGPPENSEIELVFTGGKENKEFVNINWISEIFDQNQTLLKNKTLTAIRVITSYQDSGIVTLIPFTSYGVKHNTRRYKNSWNFNRFKDANVDPYKKKAMLDNWCSVTFIFNNTPNVDDTQNSLYLYSLNAKALLAEL